MNGPSPPSPDWVYHAMTLAGILALVMLYFFGVWSRSYVFPSKGDLPLKKQVVAAIPVGLVTMSIYARSAFEMLVLKPENLAFDVTVMAGYAIVFGMLSRETLERLLKTATPAIDVSTEKP
jgi:hypothetical protein